MTTATHEIWERLHDVLTLRFTASSHAEARTSLDYPFCADAKGSTPPDEATEKDVTASGASGGKSRLGTGWRGAGSGIVDVCEATQNTLIFKEVGLWRQSGGRELRFTNLFRWSRLGDRLRLDHLRHGATRPIFLFDMALDATGVWHEVAPHPCRADSYRATLQMEGEQIRVCWRVTGPRKDEVIEYVYL